MYSASMVSAIINKSESEYCENVIVVNITNVSDVMFIHVMP